jgi:hypothetical protein
VIVVDSLAQHLFDRDPTEYADVSENLSRHARSLAGSTLPLVWEVRHSWRGIPTSDERVLVRIDGER